MEVLILKEEQIIEVARELFHKFGFKKVSMDEIARESGVTKKTIYRYFDSKEALLEYFIQEEIQNMKAELDKLKDIYQSYISAFEDISNSISKAIA